MRILRVIVLSIVVLLLLISGALAWLLGTSRGLTMLAHAVQDYVPGLRIERVEGSLGDMTVVNAAYAMPGVDVKAGRLRLATDLRALWNNQLVVEALEAQGASVRVDTNALAAPAGETPQAEAAEAALPAPWAARLEKLLLQDIRAEVDGTTIVLGEAELGARWLGSRLSVPSARIADLVVTLPEAAPEPPQAPEADKIRWRRQSPGDAKDRVRVDPASLPALVDVDAIRSIFEKPLLGHLPTVALPLSAEISDFSLEAFALARKGEGDALLSVRELRWASLALERDPVVVKLVSLHADLPEALVDGDAEWMLAQDWAGKAKFETTVREAAFARFGLNRADLVLAPAAASDSARAAEDKHPEGAPAARFGTEDVRAVLMVSGALSGELEARAALTGGADLDLVVRASPGEPGLPAAVELRLPHAGMRLAQEEAPEASDVAERSPAAAGGRPPAVATVDGLHLLLDGRADDWRGRLDASVRAEAPGTLGKPLAAELSGEMKGSLSSFMLEAFDVRLPEGSARFTMDARWGQRLDATGSFKSETLDLRGYVPEVPVAFGGGFGMRFVMRSDGLWRAAIESADLRADWQKTPIALTGGAAVSSLGWAALSDLKLALGKNAVTMNGLMKGLQSVDLIARIEAPGLDNTLPGLAGSASGHVGVRGSTLRPEIDADLRAEGLRFGPVSVASASLKGGIHPKTKAGLLKDAEAVRRAVEAFEKLDAVTQVERAFSASELTGTLRLLVEGLKVRGASEQQAAAAEDGSQETPPVLADYKSIELATSGREGDHRITLKVKGEPVALDMAWAGSLNRESMVWTGTFEKAVVTTPAGDWTQEKPSGMRFDPVSATLLWQPSAWTHEHARISLPDAVRLGEKGSARVVLEHLDLAVLKPYLARKERLQGRVKGEFKAAWDAARSAVPQADWTFDADGLSYSTRIDGVRLPVTLEALRMNGSVREEQARFGWVVKPEGTGGVRGELTIEDPMGERRMKGRILAEEMTPVLLKPLLSKGERAEGVLSADLRADGTLEAPRLWGDLNLRSVAVDASFVPFEMNPSEMTIRFEGDRSTLSGRVRTAEGDLVLEGRAAWPTVADWTASVHASVDKGSHLRLTLPPMIDLNLVPDIHASADAKGVALTGRVDVPKARITVTELPASTVDVSKDEVILDENLVPVAQASAPFPFTSRIAVGIGEDVGMDAFGLKAALKGELFVVQDERGLGLNGQIIVPAGRFHAYGQDLLVREGTIIFGGDPSNPNIRIEAIRNPDVTEDGVTVGVRVTGTASMPKVELFSDPAKPQQEMLSYLLRGQGLDTGAGDNDGQLMTSMLVGLGTATGGQVLGKIGDVVGIEDLGVDTTGVGDSAQVVVSGYILPNLQLKYGIGIFDSLATLTLRYRLMPRLYLEAVSGVSQALDVLYRFEFD